MKLGRQFFILKTNKLSLSVVRTQNSKRLIQADDS